MTLGTNLFKNFNALSLHFNDKVDYDCVKYNFKTKVRDDSFYKSNLRWTFVGVEKKLMEYDTRFILMDVYFKYYDTYQQPINVLRGCLTANKTQKEFYENIFKEDLLYLKSVYNDPLTIFECSGLYPNLYNEYKQKKISINTLLLLSIFIVDILKKEVSRDIIAYPNFVDRSNKHKQLIKYFFNQKDVEYYFNLYILGNVV